MSDRQDAFADRMVEVVTSDIAVASAVAALRAGADAIVAESWSDDDVAYGCAQLLRAQADAMLPAKKNTDTWPGRP